MWSKITGRSKKPLTWWYHKLLCEFGYWIEHHVNTLAGYKIYCAHLNAACKTGFNLYGEPLKKKQKPNLEAFRPANLVIHRNQTGHKIFELELSTLEIKETIYRSIVPKEGYWYCAALNLKNAEKEFIRMAKTIKK